MATQDQLVQDIYDRVKAIGDAQIGEDKIRNMVKESLDALLADPETARKMKFGNEADKKLVGTKFARYNLSLADVEYLYDLQEAMRGMKRVSGSGVYEGPSEDLRNTFEAISDAVYLSPEEIRAIDKRAIDDIFPRVPIRAFRGNDRKLARQGKYELTQAYQAAVRAMDTAESGYGSQLVGAEYVGQLWDVARADSRVFGLIDAFEMTAPTVYLPVEADFPELLFVSENTANNSSDYTTTKTGSQRVTVTAKKFILHQMWSGELEEDSILPFVPMLRRQQQLSVAHYSDALVLNGDDTNAGTGNINSDDADPADTKHYLAFDGIRHAGLVDNTANSKSLGAALTAAALLAAKGRMYDATNIVDWGYPNDPNDVIYVVERATSGAVLNFDEVLTLDKFGPNFTILNGQIARLKMWGHPVIMSLAIPLTDTDGKYTTTSPASNDTKGQVVTFNRRGFKAGWRRRVQTETERLPGRDQTRIISSLRLGFGRFTPTGSASGIEAADVIYNITV